MRRFLFALLLLLLSLGVHAGGLKLEVVPPVDPAATTMAAATAQPVPDSILALGPAVSNVDRIPLRFSLDSSELVKITETTTSERPEFDIAAFDETGRSVPVKYSVVGSSVELTHVTVSLVVEIPVSDAERQRQIASYIDKAIAEGTGELKEYVKQNRAAAVSYLEHLFVQNRVGNYRIRITLRDPRVEPMQAEVPVQVVDKGNFIDRLDEPKQVAQ